MSLIIRNCFLNEDSVSQLTGPGHLAYLAVAGSIAHGTANADSDIDVKGFYVNNLEYYIGLTPGEDSVISKLEVPTLIEGELHEVRKFARLALSCNPTVIETLFVNPEHYIVMTPWADVLVRNRHKFLSRRAFKSFSGYAKECLRKLGTEEESTRKQGAKRKELIAKYGYNTKNAAHLLRLLMMGIELVEDGTLTVERPERALLYEVRHGKYTIDEVKEMGNQLFARFEDIEKSGRSVLPEEPDAEYIGFLVGEIIMNRLSLQVNKKC